MDKNLEILRHSTSHVMAQAIQSLFPGTKLAIGPSIEEGFYYDVDCQKTITVEDLPKIEEKMKEIIKTNVPFIKKEISKAEAIKLFKSKDEKYKLEILDEIPDGTVTIYEHDKFIDLCRGPHLNSTGEIKAFKLLNVAGAYWRGNEKREMLQRIYGTAFFSQQELDEYLKRLEEAFKRDHRKLGKELDLFSMHESIGSGLIHWHPKGATLRKTIEDFWHEEHRKNGYQIVSTPHIASEQIYKISGHLENYADFMYSSMDIEGRPFRVKPMNCPGHIMIYKTKLHSYRELPIRFAEMGSVYRYEKSGVLHGLLRVRGFTIDDAHIFCMPNQLEEEIIKIFNFTVSMLEKFGFKDIEIYVATKPEKAIGSEENWEKATNALKNAVAKLGKTYTLDEGGGAFYGPKIDLKIKDVLGRLWQCTTIQFDFNLPERFVLTYVGDKGTQERLYMIHRALLGSLERFIGLLIEHYAGAFPVWLAPVQAIVLNITSAQETYAKEIHKKLIQEGIKAEMNLQNEKIGYKIREATMQKIPYMIIIGEKEVSSNSIAVRSRKEGDLGTAKLEEFIEKLRKIINSKGG